jgi:DNA-binding NarL/FixJ family response regulator
MSTADMLIDLGHWVYEPVSAEGALAAMETERGDILLTDAGLAGISDIDLVRQVGKLWPTVRIVFAVGDDRAKMASASPTQYSCQSRSL